MSAEHGVQFEVGLRCREGAATLSWDEVRELFFELARRLVDPGLDFRRSGHWKRKDINKRDGCWRSCWEAEDVTIEELSTNNDGNPYSGWGYVLSLLLKAADFSVKSVSHSYTHEVRKLDLTCDVESLYVADQVRKFLLDRIPGFRDDTDTPPIAGANIQSARRAGLAETAEELLRRCRMSSDLNPWEEFVLDLGMWVDRPCPECVGHLMEGDPQRHYTWEKLREVGDDSSRFREWADRMLAFVEPWSPSTVERAAYLKRDWTEAWWEWLGPAYSHEAWEWMRGEVPEATPWRGRYPPTSSLGRVISWDAPAQECHTEVLEALRTALDWREPAEALHSGFMSSFRHLELAVGSDSDAFQTFRKPRPGEAMAGVGYPRLRFTSDGDPDYHVRTTLRTKRDDELRVWIWFNTPTCSVTLFWREVPGGEDPDRPRYRLTRLTSPLELAVVAPDEEKLEFLHRLREGLPDHATLERRG